MYRLIADFRMISIHALREEGDDKRVCKGVILIISIHALREEGDYNTEAIKLLLKEFLSTPSARRATKYIWDIEGTDAISIHALREEGDWSARLPICRAS